jgi:glycerol-3-phosphate O-acyltransferase
MLNQKMNIKRIHTDKKSIFRYWLEFLKPYHKLRTKEIEALSLMLYYRYELSREIKDPDMVDMILFSTQTRSKIREDLGGMGQKVFNNLLTSLRKKNIINKENKINHVLIPNMSEDGFKLVFDFEVKK